MKAFQGLAIAAIAVLGAGCGSKMTHDGGHTWAPVAFTQASP